ncbi:MAG: hypothetical protein JNM00_09485, partial [Flavobacteriales bacterium]|nr:hypothetical protein [Flavobacteriales bacterium]
MSEFELNIKAQNELIKSLRETIPVLKDLHSATEDYANLQKQVGANAVEAMGKIEKGAATAALNNQQQAANAEKLAEAMERIAEASGLEAKALSETEKSAKRTAKAIEELVQNMDAEQVEEFTKTMQTGMKSLDTALKSPQALLRYLNSELAKMRLEGKANTETFREFEAAAVQLNKAIKDTHKSIKLNTQNAPLVTALAKSFEGLAGGVAAAQGASALFGSDGKNLDEVLVKVNGSIAL